MTADAAALLAEIRRSGGDVRLVAGDRLKLMAPTALIADLAERVRAAKPMLLAALADPGRETAAVQKEGGGVVNPSSTGATVQHRKSEPASDRSNPVPAADWRARHREALAHWSLLRTADEAASIAWGAMQDRWHRLHGERVPHWRCAGCGEPLGGFAALTLVDGNRVHLGTLDCLLSFGDRWRGEATAGLKALGLAAPTGAER